MKPGQGLIDAWFFAHLGFWWFAGSTLWALKLRGPVTFLCCLSAAFAWEWFERYAEQAWPHLWLHQERAINSYVSDPLTCVVGVLGMWWLLNRTAL